MVHYRGMNRSLLSLGLTALAALLAACSGASRPIQSLVDTLVACSPLTVEITQDAGRVRSGEQPDLYGSPDALEALGWTPTIPIEQTLSDTLAWWRERVTTEGA